MSKRGSKVLICSKRHGHDGNHAMGSEEWPEPDWGY